MRRKGIVIVVVVVAALAVWWKLHGHGRASSPVAGANRAALPGLRGGLAVPAKPAALAGRVTRKADGTGVAGAIVAIARADLGGLIGMDGPPLVATTDATGAWSVPAVPPGPYVASATAIGYLPAQSPRFTLGSGEQRTGIALVVEAGGTLVHGMVTDIGGGPVAGVHVQLQLDSIRAIDGAMLVAVTGADGRYQLAVRDGPYEATAVHEAYAHKRKSIEVAGKPVELDFTLTPGATIHGVVIARDTNKPVPRAIIEVSESARRGGGTPTAKAGDDGTFTLTSREPGMTAISATAPGYASTAPTIVRLAIGDQVDGVRVLVDHAFSISGHVVDATTKAGVAGVMVGTASTGGGGEGVAADPTGDDGAFSVFGVKPGAYLMFALSSDTVPNIGKTVQVVDKDVTGVEIALDHGATLSGRVDPPGPATMALELAGEVGIANIMQAAKASFVRGDADATGAFKLEHVPTGAFKLVARTAAGPAGSLAVTVAGGDQTGLVVRLDPRGTISGHVVDTDNAAVGGIKVSARPGEHEKQTLTMTGEHSSATTDTDGSFTIVGLDAGTYKVVAADTWQDDLMQAADKRHKPVEVDVPAGGTKSGVVITIQAKNGVISGHVTDGNGQPAPDAWVSATAEIAQQGSDSNEDQWMPSSEPVITDDAGKFAIRGLVKGAYAVVVEGPKGGSRAEQKGVHTGDSITIELAPLGTLSGHVTSSGSPVTTFDLTCKGPADPVERSFFTADGSYTLDHLAPGPYACSIDCDAGTATGKVDVPTDSATLDLPLTAWGQVTGTIVSAFDGSPVPGLSVVPQNGADGRMVQVIMGGGPQTDATGRFVIDRLPAGSSNVMVFAATSGFTPLAVKPFTLGPGQHLDVGTIKVVPPRQGDAGTFGLSVAAQNGAVVVTSIKPGGPAEAAGLVVGDSILTIDGRGVQQLGVDPSVSFLSSGSIGIGETVQLGLARGGSVAITSVKW